MDLAAKTGVPSSIEPSRDKPIYARQAIPKITVLHRIGSQSRRPTTPVLKTRVLVIDDCPANADSLVFMLSHAGYEAKAVYSGPDAIEAVKWFRPDLVIADLLLAGMSAVEAAAEIHRIANC